MFGTSCFCNHLSSLGAMTPFVNENETFKKDLQSNVYKGIKYYPNAQNVHGNHDMVHHTMDAWKINAFQQTTKLPDKSGLSFVRSCE